MVQKIITYAVVSTWSLVSSGWEHVKRIMHHWSEVWIGIISYDQKQEHCNVANLPRQCLLNSHTPLILKVHEQYSKISWGISLNPKYSMNLMSLSLSDCLIFWNSWKLCVANWKVYSSRWGVALLRAILNFNHSSCHGIEILYISEPWITFQKKKTSSQAPSYARRLQPETMTRWLTHWRGWGVELLA